MGFLIFAYRKLFLKRKINDLNYQAMVLSQKKQNITDKIGQVQQAISSAKTLTASVASYTTNALTNSIFKEFYNEDRTPKSTEAAMQAQMKLSAGQQAIATAGNLTNSLFEASDQAQLAYLNSIDSQISLQIANIDSQTKQLMPELESVEKAEDQAAKSEAPKFGLS